MRLLGLVVVYVRRKVSSTKNEAKVKEQRQTLVILAESPVDFTYDEQGVSRSRTSERERETNRFCRQSIAKPLR